MHEDTPVYNNSHGNHTSFDSINILTVKLIYNLLNLLTFNLYDDNRMFDYKFEIKKSFFLERKPEMF